jgi:hypothetical protein
MNLKEVALFRDFFLHNLANNLRVSYGFTSLATPSKLIIYLDIIFSLINDVIYNPSYILLRF